MDTLTSWISYTSPFLVASLTRVRPCVGTLPYLVLSWSWLPGQLSNGARSARRLHSLATGLAFLYAVLWTGMFLGLRFGGLRVGGALGSVSHDSKATLLVEALGIPPWAPGTDLALHLTVGLLALLAYRHSETDYVLNIHKRSRPFLSSLGRIAWFVQVVVLPPSIPSALLFVLLLGAAMISLPSGRKQTATGGKSRVEVTASGSTSSRRRSLERLVLALAWLLCALHSIAWFVFQWAWIRNTPASQSVCGYLFGLCEQSRYRVLLAQGAGLVMLGSSRLIDLSEPVAATLMGYRLMTAHAAAVLSFVLTMAITTHVPGICSYVLSVLAMLATLFVGVPVWGLVLRIAATTAAAGLGLAALILGMILSQTKRSIPTLWGLPHAGQSLFWDAVVIMNALAWGQRRVTLQSKSSLWGRLLPSEYVANFLTWALVSAALAALAQDWILTLVVVVLALAVRLGRHQRMRAWVWLPLHGWGFLVWTLRCGLCGLRTAPLLQICSLTPLQCYAWTGFVTVTAAAWVLRIQPMQAPEREKRS